MSDTNYLIEITKTLGIGILTFYAGKWQEKRKYRTSYIDSLIQKIEDIERKASEFYVLSGNDESSKEKSIIITISIRQIALMTNEIMRNHPKYASDLQRKLIQLRKCISGNQFQESCRNASGLDDSIFTNISNSCDELTLVLRNIINK